MYEGSRDFLNFFSPPLFAAKRSRGAVRGCFSRRVFTEYRGTHTHPWEAETRWPCGTPTVARPIRQPSEWTSRVKGAQLAVDTSLVSPLISSSQPRRQAGQYAAALHEAYKSKERTYPKLLQFRPCRPVVLAMETGGRSSSEAATFVRTLAHTKKEQFRASPAKLSRFPSSRWSAVPTYARPACVRG